MRSGGGDEVTLDNDVRMPVASHLESLLETLGYVSQFLLVFANCGDYKTFCQTITPTKQWTGTQDEKGKQLVSCIVSLLRYILPHSPLLPCPVLPIKSGLMSPPIALCEGGRKRNTFYLPCLFCEVSRRKKVSHFNKIQGISNRAILCFSYGVLG